MAVKAIPLPEQLHRAEQQIVLRRVAVNRRMKRLNRDVRRRLAFPLALMATAGMGLAIRVWFKRRSQAPEHETRIRDSHVQSGKMVRFFGKLVEIIAMARALSMALPPDRGCHTPPKTGVATLGRATNISP